MVQKATRQGNSDWPLTEQGLANLNDTVDDIYRRLRALGDAIDAIEPEGMTAAAVLALLLEAAQSATVATAETQASGAAYADLATAGPAVTIEMSGTIAIVWLSCKAERNGTGNSAFMTVAVSGATTVAAADTYATNAASFVANVDNILSRVCVITGLTPGSNVFTAKYKNDGGSTWTFRNRSLAVFAP